MKGNNKLIILVLSLLYLIPQQALADMDIKAINAQLEALNKQMQGLGTGTQPVSQSANATAAQGGPCSTFRQWAVSGNKSSTDCYPVSLQVDWDISEEHPGEHYTNRMKWHFVDKASGELQVLKTPGCNASGSKCIDHYRFIVPGLYATTPASRNADLKSAYVQEWTYNDGRYFVDFETSDLAKFYTNADWHNAFFQLEIFRDADQSYGHIDAPEFGWIKDGEKLDYSSIGDFQIRYEKGDSSDDIVDSIPVDNFVPSFDQVKQIQEKSGYEKVIPINYVSEHSFGQTNKRIITGSVTYKMSVTEPGKMKVTPSADFITNWSSLKKAFKPESKTYTLSNYGEEELAYSVRANANWLAIEHADGTIKPGEKIEVKVKFSQTGDNLKKDQNTASISFSNLTNHTGDTSRKVKLTRKEKWRLSIFGKNDLFFGDQYVYGGVAAKYRTDVEFEVEDGKYSNGRGKTIFVSLHGISNPLKAFDCLPLNNGYKFKYTDYAVPGSVSGGQVSLNLPANGYEVKYHCITDTDVIRDAYLGYYTKVKWGTKKQIKDQAESDVNAVIKKTTQKFNRNIVSGSLTVSLHNWKKQAGTLNSIDFDAMQMIQLE